MVERESELLEDVEATIEQRCPGFLTELRNEKHAGAEYSTWFWRRLLAWMETHILAVGTRSSSLDAVRDAARTHLRGERIAEYWAYCSSRLRRDAPIPNPRFEQWLQDADVFVASSPQHRS
jgi:hypothetical protein